MSDLYDNGTGPHEDWVLLISGSPDQVAWRGTEEEVKAAAVKRFRHVYAAPNWETRAAHLFEAIYIEKPDGSHQAPSAGPGYFTHGEMPSWIEVDW